MSLPPPWQKRRNAVTTAVIPAAVVVFAGAILGGFFIIDAFTSEGVGSLRSSFASSSSAAATASADHGSGGDPATLATRRPIAEIPWETDAPRARPSAEAPPRAAAETSSPRTDERAEPSPGAAPEKSSPRLRAQESSAPEHPVEDDGVKAIYRGKLGKGSTLGQRLGQHGLTAAQISEITQSLKGLVNFKRCRPDHTYEVAVDKRSGRVDRFRYKVSETRFFEAKRRGDELVAYRVKVPVRSRWTRVGGRVGGSLASALAKAGAHRQALKAFLQTFGREMSFRDEQQPTDTFRVIQEEELLNGKVVGLKAVWAIEYTSKGRGRRRAFYFDPGDSDAGWYDDTGHSFERTKLRTPLNYKRISSPFDLARMHPVLKRRAPHRGTDFAAARGTPVWATADGVVRFMGRKGANGNLVILGHDGGLESIYAHLQKFARGLKRGQEVSQGKVIGYVGSTGRSTGPHLHFGLRLKGRFLDPQRYRAGPGRPIAREHRAAFTAHARKLAREISRIRIR